MRKVNRDQIFSLKSEGYTNSDIAKTLNISRQRVFQILNEKEPNFQKKKEEKEKIKKEEKEKIKKEMIHLRQRGLTYQEIACRLNLSYSYVSEALREFSGQKGIRTRQQLGRFMACCCCGSSWVETIKEEVFTNCPICFSSCREMQKIYDKETLENFSKYAQKFYE